MKNPAVFAVCVALGMAVLFFAPRVGAQKNNASKATTISVEVAINRAGQQRMLSQRITKLYAQIVLGISPEKSQTTLLQSVKRFDDNLIALAEFTPSTPISETLLELKLVWSQMFVITAQAPNEARLKELVTLADSVLGTAQKLTALYEGQSRKAGTAIIGESGRQRMLSQRVALIYMLAQIRSGDVKISSDLMTLRNEFNRAHERLKASTLNDEKIKTDLAVIDGQWGFFQLAIDSKPDPAMQRNVAATSENILEIMQSVTAQYEARAAR